MMNKSLGQLIVNDDIVAASSLINDYLDKSKTVNADALAVLKVLSAFLAKLMRCNTSSKSECIHIFKVADACSSILSKTWKCNSSDFMKTIYTISDYLIKQNNIHLAKELTLYFGALIERNTLPLNGDQKICLKNTLIIFGNRIINDKSFPLLIFGQNDDSLEAWWLFLAEISKWSDHSDISLLFVFTSAMFSKVTKTSDQINLGEIVFKKLTYLLEQEVVKEHERPLKLFETQEDVSKLSSMVSTFFWMMTTDELMVTDLSNVLTFLKLLTCFTIDSKYLSQIDFMINILSLLCETDLSKFKEINHFISSQLLQTSYEVISFSSEFIFKLFKIICRRGILNSQFEDIMINIATDLRINIRYKNVESWIKFPSNKLRGNHWNRIVNHITSATLYAVLNCDMDTEKDTSKLFNAVLKTVNFFFNESKKIATSSMTDFTFAVALIRRVFVKFKAVNAFKTRELCRQFIILVRSVELSDVPHVSETLKDNVEEILLYFVEGSSLSLFSYECLTYILALVHDDSPLFQFKDKFKYWCKLKLLPENKVGDITVRDIISQKYIESPDVTVVNELTQWPFSVVTTLDSDSLLLLEIQSYLKHKELLKHPVLAVYRVAIDLIDSNIALAARIVCCVTDAFLKNEMDHVTLKKLHASIKNLIKRLTSKNKETKLDNIERQLVLGDLNFYLARCEMTFQRITSESQVIKLHPTVAVNTTDIPVIDQNELNCTIISCEFSFIAYTTQECILSLLRQALLHWSKGKTLINDIKRSKVDTLCADGPLISMKYIKACGYIFRLYKSVQVETAVWQLLYDMGELFNNAKYKIIGFSEMLSKMPIVDSKLIDEMDAYVKSQENIEKEYYYYLFLINLGMNKIYSKKYDESEQILKLMDPNKLKSSFPFIYVQLGIYSFLLNAAVNSSSDTTSHHLVPLFSICLSKKDQFSSFVEKTLCNCLLLDLSLMIGRLFCHSKELHQARNYSYKQLEMAQALHLPIRTCEFLVLHAELDLLCVSQDAAKKLQGVETILELPKWKLHPDDCICVCCCHVEYLVTLCYAMLTRAALYKLKGASSQCFDMLKDCRELISKMKKKFYGKYVTDILDCDIHFAIVAVGILSDWGKTEKASKYLNHAGTHLEKNFKCCHYELAKVSGIKLSQIIAPKLNMDRISSLYSDPELEVEDSKTPQMGIEINTPIIHHKCFTAVPEKIKRSVKKNAVKKLNFKKSPSSENIFEAENQLVNPVLTVNNTDKVSGIKNTNISSLSKRVPDVSVTLVSSESENDSSSKNNIINNSSLVQKCLQIPKTYSRKAKNFDTPKNKFNEIFEIDNNTNDNLSSNNPQHVGTLHSLITNKLSKITIDENVESTVSVNDSSVGTYNVKEKLRNKKSVCRRLALGVNSSTSHSSSESQPEVDNDLLKTSSDEASIIEATIIEEETLGSKFTKIYRLGKSPLAQSLPILNSNLCVTPCSSVNDAAVNNKKYKRKNQISDVDSVQKLPHDTPKCLSSKKLYPDQCSESNRKRSTRITRSTSKALSRKFNRI